MYMIDGPPFRLGKCSRGRPVVVDRSGEEVRLIGDAWRILHELATDERWKETEIAYVSRTDMPSECPLSARGGVWARLSEYHISEPGRTSPTCEVMHMPARCPACRVGLPVPAAAEAG